ncbi:hypothetical protein FACS1894199_11670 [Bacteroidia bacterium]|nr:hypothetical protein FACS1894199_11670 [Bacteroidia bacterium]
MFQFYFNDCFPLDKCKHDITSCFKNTLIEYKLLKTKYSDDIEGIITSQLPSQISLNEYSYTLQQCIQDIPDTNRDLRQYAYSVFRKYPIDNYFQSNDEEKLIENKYLLVIDEKPYNAFNAKIVHENNGTLFSLALHEHLCKNTLAIVDSGNNEFCIINLFGETKNTQYVEEKIKESIQSKANNFEKLKLTLGGNSCRNAFVGEFNKATPQMQEVIIQHFLKAKERNGITPFFADKELIKDVTPEKEAEIKIFELRIFEPVAYRVYFYETQGHIYLGLIEKKPNKKIQSNQIKTAVSIIKSLILVS